MSASATQGGHNYLVARRPIIRHHVGTVGTQLHFSEAFKIKLWKYCVVAASTVERPSPP